MPTKNEILAVRALRERKSRQNKGQFIVEGLKGVTEARASDFKVEAIYVTSDQAVPGVWGAEVVSAKDMERMSTLKTPPGILAVMEIPMGWAAPDTEDSGGSGADAFPPVSLALDGIADPGNLGTIIRTADWFGVRDIWVSSETVDAFNPKVVQATMGSVFRVRVRPVDLVKALGGMRAAGIRVSGLDLSGRSIWANDGDEPGQSRVAVVGSESHGISEEIKALCTDFVHIPGAGEGESLNASIAAGICLAAWTR